MGEMLPQADRLSRLNSLEKPRAAKANVTLNDFETRPELLLKEAIKRSPLTNQEVMHALGIKDPAQFSRLLDGNSKDRLWWHSMVQRLPRPVWRELVLLLAPHIGFHVRRSITLRERA